MNEADRRPNLYLVGFMGTGKSTFGRLVASRLQMMFVDSDHWIERAAGRSIPAIFSTEGESAFRAWERRFILEGHPVAGTVVACGGGLIIPPGMLDEVRARGVVVCLHASASAILARTSHQRHRPLLQAEDPAERIRRLLAERQPIYARAGTMLLTDGRSFQEVTDHIIRIYRREARDFSPRPAP